MATRVRGFWTEKRLGRAIEIIGKHDDLYEALGTISTEFQHEVSYNSLAGAMGRAGKGQNLTKYLRGTRIPPPEVKFEPTSKKIAEPLIEGEVKTLILGDLHIPCQNDAFIDQAMKQDGDADQLVINGDILDVDQISTFGQRRDGSLREEYHNALTYLAEWSLTFKRNFVNWGNHDFRPESYKRRWVNQAAHFLYGNLIDNLVNGIQYGDTSGKNTGQIDLPNVYGNGGPDGWYTKIGDCVVAHPRSFYKTPGKTVLATLRYFLRREPEVSTAIIGHTHMLYREHKSQATPIKDMGDLCDYLVVEGGCLCDEMDYTKEGKLNYEKPRESGYAVLYQIDGKTVKEKTRYVRL